MRGLCRSTFVDRDMEVGGPHSTRRPRSDVLRLPRLTNNVLNQAQLLLGMKKCEDVFITVLASYNSDHSFSTSISWPISIGGKITLFSLDQNGGKFHPRKGHEGPEGE